MLLIKKYRPSFRTRLHGIKECVARKKKRNEAAKVPKVKYGTGQRNPFQATHQGNFKFILYMSD